MNILHFGSDYLPNNGGNVIRMRKMLENNQANINDNIIVLTTAQTNNDFDDDEYYRKFNIKIVRIKKIKQSMKIIQEICKKYKIDVVVTHTIEANIIACIKLPKQIKITTEYHSLLQSTKLKMIVKKYLHRVYFKKRTSKFFVLSKGAKEYIIREYKVKKEDVIFLPNGYDAAKNNSRTKKNTFFTFGYVGTFYPWQGIDLIYHSIDKILDIDPKIRIYLVGGGFRYHDLKRKSEEYKYKGRLIITGEVPSSEIDNHMEEIDVLMIPRPSTLETETETAIPLKIFEGISYKKPLIISNVYGLTEVLGDNEAFIFNPIEENGLINACNEAFENPLLCQKKIDRANKVAESWPKWDEIHKTQRKALERAFLGDTL